MPNSSGNVAVQWSWRPHLRNRPDGPAIWPFPDRWPRLNRWPLLWRIPKPAPRAIHAPKLAPDDPLPSTVHAHPKRMQYLVERGRDIPVGDSAPFGPSI